MNPFRFTTIAHADHVVMSPLAGATVDALLDRLELQPGDHVLDVGCGNGEMLVRLAQARGIFGVGIDRNPAMIERAVGREMAGERDVGCGEVEAIEWIVGDAAGHPLLARTYDAALCVGATGALGGFRGTLSVLRGLLTPDGRALIGEGYWRREPDPEYLATLGATRDEMTDLEGVRDVAIDAGFEIVAVHESTVEEWDDYEELYAAAIERFVQRGGDGPEDPDVAGFAARIARWRTAYQVWGRSTLGFATLVLRV